MSLRDPLGLDEFSHDIPKAIWSPEAANPITLSEAAREVFNETRPAPGHRGWTKAHSLYNKAVRAEVVKWLADNRIDSIKMTGAHARELLHHIRTTKHPVISGFLNRIYHKGSAGFAHLGTLVRVLGTAVTVAGLERIVQGGCDYVDLRKVDEEESETHRFGVYEGTICKKSGAFGVGEYKASGVMLLTVKVPKACKGCSAHNGRPNGDCNKLPDAQKPTMYNLTAKEHHDMLKELGIDEEYFIMKDEEGK